MNGMRDCVLTCGQKPGQSQPVRETFAKKFHEWTNIMASSKVGKLERIAAVLEHDAGSPVEEVCQKYAISQRTFYRWRAGWQQKDAPDIDRWQALVEENRRLKNLLIGAILQGAIRTLADTADSGGAEAEPATGYDCAKPSREGGASGVHG